MAVILNDISTGCAVNAEKQNNRSGSACVLPSSVLSTHTAGFSGYTFRDLTDDMPAIKAHWLKEGIRFDAIYTVECIKATSEEENHWYGAKFEPVLGKLIQMVNE